jgi:hypothetical protein
MSAPVSALPESGYRQPGRAPSAAAFASRRPEKKILASGGLAVERPTFSGRRDSSPSVAAAWSFLEAASCGAPFFVALDSDRNIAIVGRGVQNLDLLTVVESKPVTVVVHLFGPFAMWRPQITKSVKPGDASARA